MFNLSLKVGAKMKGGGEGSGTRERPAKGDYDHPWRADNSEVQFSTLETGASIDPANHDDWQIMTSEKDIASWDWISFSRQY